MTISSTTRTAGPYAGTGTQQVFPFAFKVFVNTDMLVVLTDNTTGNVTVQTLTANYTVSLNADQNATPGGTITMLAAPPTGVSLSITSQVPLLQPTDIANVGNFYPKAVTDAFDRTTIQIQQQSASIGSTVRGLIGEQLATLPPAAVRANSVLAFDALGQPTLSTPPTGSGTALAIDLANGADPTKGVTKVAGAGRVSDSIAALKALPKTGSTRVSVMGYYVPGDGGGGQYYLDGSDTTSADNGGTTIVANDGGRWKLADRRSISVLHFGAKGDGTTDDAPAINKAVAACCALNLPLRVPAGTYRLVPGTTKTDEAGTNICAIEMFSNLHIEAVDGAVFKIADNFSTDASPIRHSMFFTNNVISNLSFYGLTMDMNGLNNKISPARPSTYSGFTNAQIIISGTPAGVAARADHVRIYNCKFLNNAGVSCIVARQTNTPGLQLSDDWVISDCTFSEVGLDTNDHSSIYGQATRLRVFRNVFRNSVPQNPTTGIGGLVACELHCSESAFIGNVVINYMQALWVTANFTEALTSGRVIANNQAKISGTFVDFWSHNVLPYGIPEGAIQNISITDNVIEITADPAAVSIKSFLKFGARLQPTIVNFSGNVCRSYDTAKETVLCLAVVGSNQLAKPDQISIRDNTCAGVTNGLVCFFNGDGATATTQNIGNITYQDNDLGVLVPSLLAGYPAADIYLYGPSTGKVEGLRVSGAQKPDTPIVTDAGAGGRAHVYGQVIIPQTVTWNGITVGNGSRTSKIALDTDAGVAIISAAFFAGSTSAATGPIYPGFSGLTADTGCGAIAAHVKTGAAVALAARVDAGASWVSLLGATGSSFGATEFATSSVISVSASFPCRFADI